MLNDISDLRRFTVSHDEVADDKRDKSAELRQDVAAFLKNGGKVQEIAPGATRLDAELPPPYELGIPQSGKPGITWSAKNKWWSVRTKNTRFTVGHAYTIRESVALQEAFESKQRFKDGKYS